jgi:TPR repeat protein
MSVNQLLTMFGKVGPVGGFESPPLQGVREMSTAWIQSGKVTFADERSEDLLVASCLAAAAQGDISAYYDLGVAYSTGSHGVDCDLIEAHKWFNLAAVSGHAEAQMCRADISDEMTAREIAEAQRRAREWISASTRKAA